jgi:MFS family permease
MVLLIVTFVGIGVFTSNVWTITQSLAGADAAGKWTGLQNAIGNVGSVASPIVTGWIVAVTGRFSLAFLAASAGLLIAAAMYLFGIGRSSRWYGRGLRNVRSKSASSDLLQIVPGLNDVVVHAVLQGCGGAEVREIFVLVVPHVVAVTVGLH